MTTYRFIDQSGETRLVGTIDPAPGGGSQPVQAATITKTAAELNAADSQANGLTLVATPGNGKIVCPIALIVGTASPDSVGDVQMLVGFGAAGSVLTGFDSLFPSAANGNMILYSENPGFAAPGDIGQEVRIWISGGSGVLDNGPYVITLLYFVTDTA